MKYLSHVQPRYIIAITIAVALLMFISAFFELHQSRNELFQVLRENSLSLAETIERSSANVVLSTEQIELQLTDRLFNNAYYAAQMDSAGSLTQSKLRQICEANGIFRIHVINRSGNRILSSHRQYADHAAIRERNTLRETLNPLFTGEIDQLIIGYKQALFEDGQRFAVAIRRTHPAGGAIVLNIDAAQFVEFKKQIGIGKLINDLGDNTGIDYVVIQDLDGILAATKQVQEISSIEQDTILIAALQRDSIITRQFLFNGHDTYEVIRRLSIDGSTIGVLRIGLSMNQIHSTEERMTRRIIIMSAVLIAVGVLIFSAIVSNQHYQTVSQKYSQIKSFTGSILENMQDAVITLDADNKISIFNKQAEKLFGINASHILDKPFSDIAEERLSFLRDFFFSDVSNKEISITCHDKSERFVSVAITRSDITMTAVIRDLTETKRLQQEIERREKLSAMGELAAGVAHEIRNPLNAISMIAQRYEKEFKPARGIKEYTVITSVLINEARRVNNIIQQFLRFARPPKLKIQPTSISDFLSQTAVLFKSSAKANGIEFSLELNCKGILDIDQEQMTQALLNILQNALEATPKEGRIQMQCSRTDSALQIDIIDSGHGILKNQLQKIFDLYYTTKPSGTGLGLAITQQIIQQHNGSIHVESEEGKGTRFCITLPIAV